MYFSLIDKITSLVPGEKIVATKSLSMAEEYLQDHFPKFPVMPGVLMIEAMTQSCAWLVRVTENFAHSMVLLQEVKNVKFGQFLQPGQTMTVTATLTAQDEKTATFKAEGAIGGKARVRAILTLCKYNLADTRPHQAVADQKMIACLKDRLDLLWERPSQK
ncbi:MAG: beta-hydroxyacyl-ACP dehydratase [Thermoguttaceae bacterium]|nr:beta-hydroxyacyl-ACP dehydratase [Thermoguttaceae bacterium]MBQ2684592.1 beta-hydroxyacyl-ACP dehydratase [Thermoguttaceae bacterium]MBQ6618647.1 beta-hydroxyacyl-ACP dehydratase [Thermoguttaceae bacterium]MBR2586399.1 beta-hydroxyacyl-ACP dehydratase [Thermoguttaceae bacterium]